MNIARLAFNTAKPPLDNPEVRHARRWRLTTSA